MAHWQLQLAGFVRRDRTAWHRLDGILAQHLSRSGKPSVGIAGTARTPSGRARDNGSRTQGGLVLAFRLPHDLGHDDRLLLLEFRHLLFHYLVSHLSDPGPRLLARAAGDPGPAAGACL